MHREIREFSAARLIVAGTLAFSLACPGRVLAAPSEAEPEPEVAAAEAGTSEPTEPDAVVAEPEPEPEPVIAPPPLLPLPPPTQIEVDPGNYRMVLAGNIVIGLGGAALVAMAVGLGLRADAVTQRQALRVGSDPDLDAIARQDDRIRNGTISGLTGGIAAASLFATGITLVALGYKRERKRRAALPSAAVSPDGVAVHWVLRF